MTQQVLFTNEQCPPPRRPVGHGDAFDKAVAARLASVLREELGDDLGGSDEEVAEDLADVLHEDDGYRLARALEEKGWDPDARMVEVLDGAGSLKYDVNRDAVRAWVMANNINPPLECGAMVRFSIRHVDHSGEIVRIDLENARYVVFCAALGHLREGTPEYENKVRNGGASSGVYLNYEDVQEMR